MHLKKWPEVSRTSQRNSGLLHNNTPASSRTAPPRRTMTPIQKTRLMNGTGTTIYYSSPDKNCDVLEPIDGPCLGSGSLSRRGQLRDYGLRIKIVPVT